MMMDAHIVVSDIHHVTQQPQLPPPLLHPQFSLNNATLAFNLSVQASATSRVRCLQTQLLFVFAPPCSSQLPPCTMRPAFAPLAPKPQALSADKTLMKLLASISLTLAFAAAAQSPLITTAISEQDRAPLPNSVHPLVAHATDLGALDPAEPLSRLLLVLRRAPAQEAALNQFISSAHSPGNPNYHKWLKPDVFARNYGPTDSDIEALGGWLQSHGLSVDKLHAGRTAIEFSGTAGQLQEAFHTTLHRYSIHGREFIANANSGSVPAALAPLILGLVPATSIQPVSYLSSPGQAQYNPQKHTSTPLWDIPTGSSTPSLAVAPFDLYTQYDMNAAFSNNINGYSQWIAIVSASNIDVTVIKDYQAIFSVPGFLPQIVIDGDDPGINTDSTEAYLDTELAMAAAPRARVLLYVSAGSATTSGLYLAAMRAVEDDLAGVISMSYGECEANLGVAGNAFWYQLWQQAAAQGQTVFVAAGDSGSAGCDNFSTESQAFQGFAVNGIASTPFNIAVGATDFYYSQYNGTSSALNSQIASYWLLSPTAFPSPNLNKTIPEQPWNTTLGYNILSDLGTQSTWNILATGGGASNAALSVNGKPAGYPKPAWQSAVGVPADGLRDLPDLALFGGTGANYSFYPICATLIDCTSFNTAGGVLVTAVGGTSAAAPIMAGIQSLVNQFTGSWQGQANFVYYPLFAAAPSAFHDLTTGQNTVLCINGTPNCVSTGAPQNLYVESGFTTGTGYDQASGLGSVDAWNLIKNWSSVTFKPTWTSLGFSSTNFVHGTSVTVTSTVAPVSGSGTPTGTIALSTVDGVSRAGSFDDIPLANGTASALIDNLPGGSYYVMATYSGDGTYGASSSSYTTINISPENDYILGSGWVQNPYDLNFYPLQAGITLPYGANLYLDAELFGVNEHQPNQLAAATGSMTFTDSAGGSSTQPIEVNGIAEWANGNFAPGSHSISLNYPGDASYKSSAAANVFSFSILKGNTVLKLIPLSGEVAPGGTATVDVQLYMGYQPLLGSLPTGPVSVTLGSVTQNVAMGAYGAGGSQYLEGIATFTNLPAGILPLTAAYAGDANWLGASANGGTVVALSTLMTPTIALTPASASIAPAQSQNFTVTVTGQNGKAVPTGSVTLESDDQSFQVSQKLTVGATYSAAWFTVPANSFLNGNNTLVAVYSGDSNYTGAASNSATLNVNESDFRLTLLNTSVDIPAGGSAQTTLVITPVNGYSGPVSVTASAGPGLDIEFANITPNVSSVYNDTTTIYTSASLNPWTYPVLISGIGGGHMHTLMIYVLAH